MAQTAIQQVLGNITVPPTPKVGGTPKQMEQATATWTKQAQQAIKRIAEVLGQLNTSIIPEGTGAPVIGNVPTPPGVFFTNERARAAVSATSPVLYDQTTGVFSIQFAKADGAFFGAATFAASDFDDDGAGLISIDYVNGQKATGSLNGFLLAADWTTFNNKVSTTRAINTTAPLTGGGDLSADRTFAIPKSDSTHDGYLAAADFATFLATSTTNAKADGVTKGIATFLAADFNDDGAGLISLDYTNGQKATGSVPGFLSSTDWTTFNSKVSTSRAINTTAPLTGGGDLSADRTFAISDFVASGASHARGAVPDPGASAGSTKFLREDATWAVPPSVVISSNTTYFVDVTNGNDSNDGLAAGAGRAFQTIQKGVNVASGFVIAGGVVVTISIADGTYNETVQLGGISGGGSILIQGNTTTPANVIVQGGSAAAFGSNTFSAWTIDGMEVRSSSGTALSANSGLLKIGSHFRFGAASIHHLIAQFGGIVTFLGNYSIVGGTTSGSHIVAIWGGAVNLFFGATVTLSGTPNFAQAFVNCQVTSSVFAWSQTYSGSGTGKRYIANGNGVIDTNAAATTYFPGNVAGTTATGGQYI